MGRLGALLSVGAVLVTGALAAGCGVALTAGGGLGIALLKKDSGTTNVGPSLSVTTPSGVVNDVIGVDYRLIDPEEDRASVRVEFSTDGGASFVAATQSVIEGAEGVESLTTSAVGEDHTFTWNASYDLGYTNTSGVILRLTPVDPTTGLDAGDAQSTAAFDVLNELITTVAKRPASAGVQVAGIAVDRNASGTGVDGLVLGDFGGHRVLRVDAATGDVAVLAGTGEPGYNGDGRGADVLLNTPLAVASVADPGGGADDVLVSEVGNQVVRQIDGTTGFVTLVAGRGWNSGEDAAAAEAFIVIGDLAADDGGNPFFIDYGVRVRTVNRESALPIDFQVGNAYPGLFSSPPANPLQVEPDRVSTVIARNPAWTGSSALSAAHFGNGAALALYDDGAGARTAYVLDAGNLGAGGAATDYPRLMAANLSAGTITLTRMTGGTIDVAPGDIAHLATGTQIPKLDFLSDMAVFSRDVLLLSSTATNAVYAANLSTSSTSVLGVAIAPGQGTLVFGQEYVPGLYGDGEGPRTAQLLQPISVGATPEGHVLVGEAIGRLRIAASPSQDFTLGSGFTIPAGQVGTAPVTVPGLTLQPVKPLFMDVGPDGDLFVSDGELLDPRSMRIYRIDSATGAATSTLGSGVIGNTGDGGPADEAQIGMIGLPAVTPDGGLLLGGDFFHHRVRAVNLGTTARTYLGVTIDPGEVETIAGTGQPSPDPASVGDGGVPTSVTFNEPIALDVGPRGLLWISDNKDFRVRVCNPGTAAVDVLGVSVGPGRIETVLGRAGTQGTLSLDSTTDVATAVLDHAAALFGSDGVLYVLDGGNDAAKAPRIRAVNLGTAAIVLGGVTVGPNEIVRVIGSGLPRAADDSNLGDGGPALSATFRTMSGFTRRGDGVVFVSDADDHRIRAVNLSAADRTIGGVVLGSGEIMTVVGTGVPAFDGDPTSVAAGLFGLATGGGVNEPFMVHAFDDGRLLFCDSANGAVRLANLGAAPARWGGVTAQPGEVAVVAGSRAGRVRPSTPVAIEATGANEGLVFTDTGPFGDQPAVLGLDPVTRIVTRVAGTGDRTAPGDGNLGDGGDARLATFHEPTGLALDGAGSIYVADARAGRVRFVNRSGSTATPLGHSVEDGAIVSVVYGEAGDINPGNDVGRPGATENPAPVKDDTTEWVAPIAVDAAGSTLWVADVAYDRVLRFDVTTGSLDAQFFGEVISSGSGNLVAGIFGERYVYDATATFYGDGAREGDFLRLTSGPALSVEGVPTTYPVVVDVNGALATTISHEQALTPTSVAVTYEVVKRQEIQALAAVSGTLAYAAYADWQGEGSVVQRLGWNGGGWDAPVAIAGTGQQDFNGDRLIATAMNLGEVRGIAAWTDPNGSQVLFLADVRRHRVVAVNLEAAASASVAGFTLVAGEARTVAGTGVGGYNGDALPPELAQLNQPTGLAVGARDGLYVADRNNGRIRRFQLFPE